MSADDLLAGHPRYQKIKDLNKGSFGFVIEALDKQDNTRVAIKFLPRGRAINEYVERELEAHRLLWHPHIVKLLSVFLTPTHLAVVMELANGGDMYEYVSSRGRVRESQARWLFQQLLVALDYLHRMGVANRDIKLENTLLSGGNPDRPLVKLCDMGFAKHLQMHSAPNSTVGTPTYFAPEVIDARTYDGMVADIWSCGVMLYVMLYGQYPFERPADAKLKAAQAQQALLKRIRAVDYEFDARVAVSDDAKDCIRRMLVKDPAQRATMAQLFEHPFFCGGAARRRQGDERKAARQRKRAAAPECRGAARARARGQGPARGRCQRRDRRRRRRIPQRH